MTPACPAQGPAILVRNFDQKRFGRLKMARKHVLLPWAARCGGKASLNQAVCSHGLTPISRLLHVCMCVCVCVCVHVRMCSCVHRHPKATPEARTTTPRAHKPVSNHEWPVRPLFITLVHKMHSLNAFIIHKWAVLRFMTALLEF